MSAKHPKHHAHVIIRIARDRNAPDDDDAAPLLKLIEYPGEIGVERRMAAMLRQDLTEPQPLLAKSIQQLLERRGVPSVEVEGDVILPEIVAAPGHPLIGHAQGHRVLRAGRMLAPFPIARNCWSRIRPLRDFNCGPTMEAVP